MQEQSRQEREWEHWPGRRPPDESLRNRLRWLFTPTDDEEAVEALITERSREIEAQAERLQSTIEGLERREEQAARLRAAVEEMLRQGSAELDERQAELTALAAELRAREEQLQEREHEVAERTQELGAVELRRAAVARREQAADEREASLEQAAAEVRRRELELRDDEHDFEARVAEAVAAAAPQPAAEPGTHLLYVMADTYRLVERDGTAPTPGSVVDLDGVGYEVMRVGHSLLPGDARRCAYLEPARPPAED
jgi:septal ring factor EnvC (AmiA/AmiB activator)